MTIHDLPNPMKIISVVGARPNFMKVAPVIKAINKHNTQLAKRLTGKQANHSNMQHLLVHTGQHYDDNMSDNFFRQLEIPEPDINLGVGSASHAEQTGKIMIEFEKVLLQQKPNMVIVLGDVNSTIACSLVASKLGIQVAHIEAGLRSFDRSMPEEVNRVLTDAITDMHFTTEASANKNLTHEGIPQEKIFFVGNVMIDTLVSCLDKIKDARLPFNNIEQKSYALITLHRPSNVDNPVILGKILDAFYNISKRLKLVIPLHPRTRKNIETFGFQDKLNEISNNAIITDPIGYLELLILNRCAKLVITDSGGLQEETTFLGIPCITMRNNTERPSTVDLGTNVIVGNDLEAFYTNFDKIMLGDFKNGRLPPLWDGKTAERIVEIISSRT